MKKENRYVSLTNERHYYMASLSLIKILFCLKQIKFTLASIMNLLITLTYSSFLRFFNNFKFSELIFYHKKKQSFITVYKSLLQIT